MDCDHTVELQDLRERLERIETMMLKADATISKVADEVMPTIESLSGHPLLKALTFGKKG